MKKTVKILYDTKGVPIPQEKLAQARAEIREAMKKWRNKNDRPTA